MLALCGCGMDACGMEGCGIGGVLLSLGDFRAPALSLSVTRDDLASGEEFELFMRLLGTYCDCIAMVTISRDDYIDGEDCRAIILNVRGYNEMTRLTIM